MNCATRFNLDFARAHGSPVCRARIKIDPGDFHVTELLGFEPAGSGEHLFLKIRKVGSNTAWVAGQLARFLDIRTRDVGYAGLKDRHAETVQWFSCWLPGRHDPGMMKFSPGGVEVLESSRHTRKLRRGALKANLFKLTLREIPEAPEVRAALQSRLELLDRDGVPNYFGEQRFGRDGGNLVRADRLLRGEISVPDRHKRGLYLSSARAYLFNLILSGRVADKAWNPVEACANRTWGPLYGTGMELAPAEERILGEWPAWCRGLEQLKLKGARRSLALMPMDLKWDHSHCGELRLQFGLPAGSYATAVLRELVESGSAESGFAESGFDESGLDGSDRAGEWVG